MGACHPFEDVPDVHVEVRDTEPMEQELLTHLTVIVEATPATPIALTPMLSVLVAPSVQECTL